MGQGGTQRILLVLGISLIGALAGDDSGVQTLDATSHVPAFSRSKLVPSDSRPHGGPLDLAAEGRWGAERKKAPLLGASSGENSGTHTTGDAQSDPGPTCVFERQLGKTIPQVLPDSDTFPDLEDGKHACLQVSDCTGVMHNDGTGEFEQRSGPIESEEGASAVVKVCVTSAERLTLCQQISDEFGTFVGWQGNADPASVEKWQQYSCTTTPFTDPGETTAACQDLSTVHGVFPGWSGDTALDDKDTAFWTAHHCITAPVQTPEQVAEECQRLRTEHEIDEGGQWGSADEKAKAYWSFHECADVLAALGRCMESCEKPCAEQEELPTEQCSRCSAGSTEHSCYPGALGYSLGWVIKPSVVCFLSRHQQVADWYEGCEEPPGVGCNAGRVPGIVSVEPCRVLCEENGECVAFEHSAASMECVLYKEAPYIALEPMARFQEETCGFKAGAEVLPPLTLSNRGVWRMIHKHSGSRGDHKRFESTNLGEASKHSIGGCMEGCLEAADCKGVLFFPEKSSPCQQLSGIAVTDDATTNAESFVKVFGAESRGAAKGGLGLSLGHVPLAVAEEPVLREAATVAVATLLREFGVRGRNVQIQRVLGAPPDSSRLQIQVEFDSEKTADEASDKLVADENTMTDALRAYMQSRSKDSLLASDMNVTAVGPLQSQCVRDYSKPCPVGFKPKGGGKCYQASGRLPDDFPERCRDRNGMYAFAVMREDERKAWVRQCDNSVDWPCRGGISTFANTELPGTHYENVPEITNPDVCEEKCANDARCLMFSWDQTDFTCKLSDVQGSTPQYNALKVSGLKLSHSFRLQRQVMYHGQDFKLVQGTLLDCESVCSTGCVGFARELDKDRNSVGCRLYTERHQLVDNPSSGMWEQQSAGLSQLVLSWDMTAVRQYRVPDHSRLRNRAVLSAIVQWAESDHSDQRGRLPADVHALEFGAGDQHVQGEDFLPVSGDSDFTVSVWVKWTDDAWPSSDRPACVFGINTTDAARGLELTIRDRGKVALELGDQAMVTEDRLTLNRWYHIAATKAHGLLSSTGIIYINGIKATSAFEGSTESKPRLLRGYPVAGLLRGATFKGPIAFAQVYAAALSSEEIAELAQPSQPEHPDWTLTLSASEVGVVHLEDQTEVFLQSSQGCDSSSPHCGAWLSMMWRFSSGTMEDGPSAPQTVVSHKNQMKQLWRLSAVRTEQGTFLIESRTGCDTGEESCGLAIGPTGDDLGPVGPQQAIPWRFHQAIGAKPGEFCIESRFGCAVHDALCGMYLSIDPRSNVVRLSNECNNWRTVSHMPDSCVTQCPVSKCNNEGQICSTIDAGYVCTGGTWKDSSLYTAGCPTMMTHEALIDKNILSGALTAPGQQSGYLQAAFRFQMHVDQVATSPLKAPGRGVQNAANMLVQYFDLESLEWMQAGALVSAVAGEESTTHVNASVSQFWRIAQHDLNPVALGTLRFKGNQVPIIGTQDLTPHDHWLLSTSTDQATGSADSLTDQNSLTGVSLSGSDSWVQATFAAPVAVTEVEISALVEPGAAQGSRNQYINGRLLEYSRDAVHWSRAAVVLGIPANGTAVRVRVAYEFLRARYWRLATIDLGPHLGPAFEVPEELMVGTLKFYGPPASIQPPCVRLNELASMAEGAKAIRSSDAVEGDSTPSAVNQLDGCAEVTRWIEIELYEDVKVCEVEVSNGGQHDAEVEVWVSNTQLSVQQDDRCGRSVMINPNSNQTVQCGNKVGKFVSVRNSAPASSVTVCGLMVFPGGASIQQSRASKLCNCDNMLAVRPEWGIDSNSCMQPAEDPKDQPWCFCEGGGWEYCTAILSPSNTDFESWPAKYGLYFDKAIDPDELCEFLGFQNYISSYRVEFMPIEKIWAKNKDSQQIVISEVSTAGNPQKRKVVSNIRCKQQGGASEGQVEYIFDGPYTRFPRFVPLADSFPATQDSTSFYAAFELQTRAPGPLMLLDKLSVSTGWSVHLSDKGTICLVVALVHDPTAQGDNRTECGSTVVNTGDLVRIRVGVSPAALSIRVDQFPENLILIEPQGRQIAQMRTSNALVLGLDRAAGKGGTGVIPAIGQQVVDIRLLKLGVIGLPEELQFETDPNFCITLADGNAVNGGGIILWRCNSKRSQQWVVTIQSEIQYAADRTYCINLVGGAAAHEPTLNLWKCDGSQKWIVGSNGTNIESVVKPGLCLNLQALAIVNGGRIDLEDCNMNYVSKKWLWGTERVPPEGFGQVYAGGQIDQHRFLLSSDSYSRGVHGSEREGMTAHSCGAMCAETDECLGFHLQIPDGKCSLVEALMTTRTVQAGPSCAKLVEYIVTVNTGDAPSAGSTGNLHIMIFGYQFPTSRQWLQMGTEPRGADRVTLTDMAVGELDKIIIDTDSFDSWDCSSIEIQVRDQVSIFECGLTLSKGDRSTIELLSQPAPLLGYKLAHTGDGREQKRFVTTEDSQSGSSEDEVTGSVHRGLSFEKCGEMCNDDPECAGLVISKPDNVCFLVNRVVVTETSLSSFSYVKLQTDSPITDGLISHVSAHVPESIHWPTWWDLSGSKNHAVQADREAQPRRTLMRGTGQQKAFHAMRFDGLNDGVNFDFALSRPYTCFIVDRYYDPLARTGKTLQSRDSANNWMLGLSAGDHGYFADGWVYKNNAGVSWRVSTATGFETTFSGYVGCWGTGGGFAVLDGAEHGELPADGNQFEVAACRARCTGSAYFGLQNQNLCFCGDSINENLEAEGDTMCNLPCSVDKTTSCGAEEFMSVYTVSERKPKEQGCFANIGDADVDALAGTGWIKVAGKAACFQECYHKGSKFVFVAHRGRQCACTNQMGSAAEATSCSTSGTGSPDAYSVYAIHPDEPVLLELGEDPTVEESNISPNATVSFYFANGLNKTWDAQPQGAPGRLGIGSVEASAPSVTADVAEVLCYDRVLTLLERNTVEIHLGQKYSIKVHSEPYKLSVTTASPQDEYLIFPSAFQALGPSGEQQFQMYTRNCDAISDRPRTKGQLACRVPCPVGSPCFDVGGCWVDWSGEPLRINGKLTSVQAFSVKQWAADCGVQVTETFMPARENLAMWLDASDTDSLVHSTGLAESPGEFTEFSGQTCEHFGHVAPGAGGSQEGCRLGCLAQPGCNAFAWNPDTLECQLFVGCQQPLVEDSAFNTFFSSSANNRAELKLLRWKDKSSLQKDLVPIGMPPSWVEGTKNGHPAVRFDGTDAMRTAPRGGSGLSVFAVIQVPTARTNSDLTVMMQQGDPTVFSWEKYIGGKWDWQKVEPPPVPNSKGFYISERQQYCPPGQDIESLVDCRGAAKSMGQEWKGGYEDPEDHRFCLWKGDEVYFNQAPVGAKEPPSSSIASVCNQGCHILQYETVLKTQKENEILWPKGMVGKFTLKMISGTNKDGKWGAKGAKSLNKLKLKMLVDPGPLPDGASPPDQVWEDVDGHTQDNGRFLAGNPSSKVPNGYPLTDTFMTTKCITGIEIATDTQKTDVEGPYLEVCQVREQGPDECPHSAPRPRAAQWALSLDDGLLSRTASFVVPQTTSSGEAAGGGVLTWKSLFSTGKSPSWAVISWHVDQDQNMLRRDGLPAAKISLPHGWNRIATEAGRAYVMSETEVYCARGQDIETEAECSTAANALGKHWGSVFNTENDHRFCLYDNVRDKVYYNLAGNRGAQTPPSENYASLCIKGNYETGGSASNSLQTNICLTPSGSWTNNPKTETWVGSLADAKDKCNAQPDCTGLLDVGGDGENWRACKTLKLTNSESAHTMTRIFDDASTMLGESMEVQSGGTAATAAPAPAPAAAAAEQVAQAEPVLPAFNVDGQELVLGAAVNNSYGLQGWLSEMMLFNRTLHVSEIEQIECKLGSKWGIVVEGCESDLSVSDMILTALPVALWELEEQSGYGQSSVEGSVFNAYNRGVDWNTDGVHRTRAAFFGGDGYLEVPFEPKLNQPTFTIMCWARAVSGLGRRVVISSTDDVPRGWRVLATPDNRWSIELGDGSAWAAISGTAAFFVDQWYQIIAMYDGAKLDFYIDGTLQQSKLTKFVPNSHRPLYIGASGKTSDHGHAWVTTHHFIGSVDNVAIIGHTLRPEAITPYSVQANGAWQQPVSTVCSGGAVMRNDVGSSQQKLQGGCARHFSGERGLTVKILTPLRAGRTYQLELQYLSNCMVSSGVDKYSYEALMPGALPRRVSITFSPVRNSDHLHFQCSDQHAERREQLLIEFLYLSELSQPATVLIPPTVRSPLSDASIQLPYAFEQDLQPGHRIELQVFQHTLSKWSLLLQSGATKALELTVDPFQQSGGATATSDPATANANTTVVVLEEFPVDADAWLIAITVTEFGYELAVGGRFVGQLKHTVPLSTVCSMNINAQDNAVAVGGIRLFQGEDSMREQIKVTPEFEIQPVEGNFAQRLWHDSEQQPESIPLDVVQPGSIYIRGYRDAAQLKACSNGGGATFELLTCAQAYVLCEAGSLGEAPEGWLDVAGTDVSMYQKTLQPGKHTVCCEKGVTSGVFMKKSVQCSYPVIRGRSAGESCLCGRCIRGATCNQTDSMCYEDCPWAFTRQDTHFCAQAFGRVGMECGHHHEPSKRVECETGTVCLNNVCTLKGVQSTPIMMPHILTGGLAPGDMLSFQLLRPQFEQGDFSLEIRNGDDVLFGFYVEETGAWHNFTKFATDFAGVYKYGENATGNLPRAFVTSRVAPAAGVQWDQQWSKPTVISQGSLSQEQSKSGATQVDGGGEHGFSMHHEGDLIKLFVTKDAYLLQASGKELAIARHMTPPSVASVVNALGEGVRMVASPVDDDPVLGVMSMLYVKQGKHTSYNGIWDDSEAVEIGVSEGGRRAIGRPAEKGLKFVIAGARLMPAQIGIFKIQLLQGTNIFFGITTKDADIRANKIQDKQVHAWAQDGAKGSLIIPQGVNDTFRENDWLALRYADNTLEFYHNGVSRGIVMRDIDTKDYFPVVGAFKGKIDVRIVPPSVETPPVQAELKASAEVLQTKIHQATMCGYTSREQPNAMLSADDSYNLELANGGDAKNVMLKFEVSSSEPIPADGMVRDAIIRLYKTEGGAGELIVRLTSCEWERNDLNYATSRLLINHRVSGRQQQVSHTVNDWVAVEIDAMTIQQRAKQGAVCVEVTLVPDDDEPTQMRFLSDLTNKPPELRLTYEMIGPGVGPIGNTAFETKWGDAVSADSLGKMTLKPGEPTLADEIGLCVTGASGKLAFRTSYGQWLNVDENGDLYGKDSVGTPGPTAQFLLDSTDWQPSTAKIVTSFGKRLSAARGSGISGRSNSIGPNEAFNVSGWRVVVQALSGRYLSASPSGELQFSARTIGYQQIFELSSGHIEGHSTISMRSYTGSYLGLTPDGALEAAFSTVENDQSFRPELGVSSILAGTVAFRTSNGSYWQAPESAAGPLEARAINIQKTQLFWVRGVPREGQLRLRDRVRVEVFENGAWGTVCQDVVNEGGEAFANVVCRELGFEHGGEYVSPADTPDGHGQIAIDVTPFAAEICRGDESALSQCTVHSRGRNDCTHEHDIGVKCHKIGPPVKLPKPEGEWPFEVNSKDTTGNYPAAQTNDTKFVQGAPEALSATSSMMMNGTTSPVKLGKLEIRAKGVLSLWFKPTDLRPFECLLSTSSRSQEPALLSGSIRLQYGTIELWDHNIGMWTPISFPNSAPAGHWTHLVLEWHDNMMQTFVNGVVMSQIQFTPAFASTSLMLGAPFDGNKGTGFVGYLSELRIWKSVLTSEQLSGLVKARYRLDSVPLAGCVPDDSNPECIVVDFVGVRNGDFEAPFVASGSAAGLEVPSNHTRVHWTQLPDSIGRYESIIKAHSGRQAYLLNTECASTSGGIEQVFAVNPKTVYVITFSAAQWGNPDESLPQSVAARVQVSNVADKVEVLNEAFFADGSAQLGEWSTFRYTFASADDQRSAGLRFEAAAGACIVLDSVKVDQGELAVPPISMLEPADWVGGTDTTETILPTLQDCQLKCQANTTCSVGLWRPRRTQGSCKLGSELSSKSRSCHSKCDAFAVRLQTSHVSFKLEMGGMVLPDLTRQFKIALRNSIGEILPRVSSVDVELIQAEPTLGASVELTLKVRLPDDVAVPETFSALSRRLTSSRQHGFSQLLTRKLRLQSVLLAPRMIAISQLQSSLSNQPAAVPAAPWVHDPGTSDVVQRADRGLCAIQMAFRKSVWEQNEQVSTISTSCQPPASLEVLGLGEEDGPLRVQLNSEGKVSWLAGGFPELGWYGTLHANILFSEPAERLEPAAGWVTAASSTMAAGFQTHGPMCVLQGSLVSEQVATNGAELCVLPEVCRPTQQLLMAVATDTGPATLDITIGGRVTLAGAVSLSKATAVSLANLVFVRTSLAESDGAQMQLLTGWRPGPEVQQPPSVYKHGTLCLVEGIVASDRTTPKATVTVLPPACHPNTPVQHTVATDNGVARVTVQTDGRVQYHSAGVNATTGTMESLSLSGVWFVADKLGTMSNVGQMSWADAADFCTTQNPDFQLCSRQQVCPDFGALSRKDRLASRGDSAEAAKVEGGCVAVAGGAVWAPVSDRPNEWVSLACAHPKATAHPQCLLYSETLGGGRGTPEWGVKPESQQVATRIKCCRRAAPNPLDLSRAVANSTDVSCIASSDGVLTIASSNSAEAAGCALPLPQLLGVDLQFNLHFSGPAGAEPPVGFAGGVLFGVQEPTEQPSPLSVAQVMWSDSDHQYSVSGVGESAAVLAAAYNETETTEGDDAIRKTRKLLQASDVVADVVGEVGAHWELVTSGDAKMDVMIDGQPVQQQVPVPRVGNFVLLWASAGTTLQVSGAAVAVLENPSNCWHDSVHGSDYRGNVAVTEAGRVCQMWSLQAPHVHPQITPFQMPWAGLGTHNNCRNPNGRERPWCFTNDPQVEWEYCNVGASDCFPGVNTALIAHWLLDDGEVKNMASGCCSGTKQGFAEAVDGMQIIPNRSSALMPWRSRGVAIAFAGQQLIQATNAGPLQQNFQEMSITAWITAPKPRGNITDAMLVGRGERVWELVWNNASQLVLHIGDVNVTSDSLTVPRDGTWHFVACTYRHSTPHGAKVQFFVDGHKPMVHERPADQMQIPVATTELTIGGSLTSDKFFKGGMRELRLYSRQLTLQDVDQIMGSVECLSSLDRFDPQYYRERYPDTGSLSDVEAEVEYREVGIDEQRVPCMGCCPGGDAQLYIDMIPWARAASNIEATNAWLTIGTELPLIVNEGVRLSRQLSVSTWLQQEENSTACVLSSPCFSLCFNRAYANRTLAGIPTMVETTALRLLWRGAPEQSSEVHTVELMLDDRNITDWHHVAVAVNGDSMVAKWSWDGKQESEAPMTKIKASHSIQFPGKCSSAAPLEIGSNSTTTDGLVVEPVTNTTDVATDGLASRKEKEESQTAVATRTARKLLQASDVEDADNPPNSTGKIAMLRWYERLLKPQEVEKMAANIPPALLHANFFNDTNSTDIDASDVTKTKTKTKK